VKLKVFSRENKEPEHKRIGEPTLCPGLAEMCACKESDACQAVDGSTLTASVFLGAHTSERAVTNELCLICTDYAGCWCPKPL